MKTSIATIALCLGFTMANGQVVKEENVPANVKESFSKKYPGLKVEKWENEGADYEAEFHLNKFEASATFEADGKFIEVEQEIQFSEFPKSAADYCNNAYKGYKISESSKITDSTGKVMYKAELKNGKEHFDVIFDDMAKFIRKTDVSTKGKTKK